MSEDASAQIGAPPDVQPGKEPRAAERSNRITGLRQSWRDADRKYPLVSVIGLFVALFATHQLVRQFLYLPQERYDSLFLLYAALASNLPLLVAATVAALIGWRVRAWQILWPELAHGRVLRFLVVLLAAGLAWSVATPEWNPYFHRWYGVDRALAAALVIAMWWRPASILPLLALLALLLGLRDAPGLGGSILAHKLHMLFALEIFASAMVLRIATGRFPVRAFVFVFCTAIAAAYWEAAAAKWSLNWLFDNELHLILPAAHAHGWLHFLTPADVTELVSQVAPLTPLLQAVVLGSESLCILMLLNRRMAIALLLILCAFHAGVFVFYGFLFWTWILVNLVLAALLWQTSPDCFGRYWALGGIAVIACGGWWAHAPPLGWLDTRLTYTYEVHAITRSGNQVAVDPSAFGPFADSFTMTGFSYLSNDHAVLTGPYGVTHNADLARKLRKELTPDAIFALENQYKSQDQPDRRDRLHQFLERFAQNPGSQNDATILLKHIGAPRQFWGNRREPLWDQSEAITALTVTELTSWFPDTTDPALVTNPNSFVIRRLERLRVPVALRVGPQ